MSCLWFEEEPEIYCVSFGLGWIPLAGGRSVTDSGIRLTTSVG